MKRFISLMFCVIFVMQFSIINVVSAVTLGNGTTISSAGACVMDYETGQILYEHNGNVPRVPASMTKIMNVYLIYEALAKGKINLNTVVPISENVYNKSRNATYQSVLPLSYNKKYTVDQMLDVIVVYSASGAAIAMAELIGGSEENFVKMMNNKAAQLGIDAYYYDSCGIANNELSPIGMATLARRIISDYPDILKRSSKKSVNFHGQTYKTTNHLLDTYYYQGADGLKTGTTPAAGYCFCGTAVRNGKRLISVTMASSSTGQRFIDTARLLDYGFDKLAGKVGNEPISRVPSVNKNKSILFTDMRTFINGKEVPTFVYDGINTHSVIIAEDLANYGFDVTFDAQYGGLKVKYNPLKQFTPISMDYYRNKKGEVAYDIYDNRMNVSIQNGTQSYEVKETFNVNGYVCIPVDELSNLFDFKWNNEELAAYIDTTKKPGTAQASQSQTPSINPNDPRYKKIYFTNMRTVINGEEIPTLAYNGYDAYAVVVAEDLAHYGFDVSYDPWTSTVTISYNPEKRMTPIPLDYFQDKNGKEAYDIFDKKINVKLVEGDKQYIVKNTYNIDGYVCIPIDELGNMYAYRWDNDERVAYIAGNDIVFGTDRAVGSRQPQQEQVTLPDGTIINTDIIVTRDNKFAEQKERKLYFTDLRTQINGKQIPTLLYEKSLDHSVIMVEYLKYYGFEIYYNHNAKTIRLEYNPEKKTNPIHMEYFRGKNGQEAASAYESEVTVKVFNGVAEYIINEVYNADGLIYISARELGNVFRYVLNTPGSMQSIVVENKSFDDRFKEPPKEKPTAAPATPEPTEVPAILPNGEILTSKSAYVMDYHTGKELYSYKADEMKPVASIAKMMSVYVILDAIKNGEITLKSVVPISENVYKLSRVEDYKMMVNLDYDVKYTVDQMLDMIIIDSAAACVTAVAELISGSEAEFVNRMNAKAHEIGIRAVFSNGTGVCLNPSTDKENLMSAKDVAIMTRRMIQDYPEVLERTKQPSVKFHGKTYYNLNKMFTDFYYEGADGFKNGMTNASGYCMCGTAYRNGKRVITVTLPSSTNEARFTDTAKMFDYGFEALGLNVVRTDYTSKTNTPTLSSGDAIKINIDGNYEMKFKGAQPATIGNVVMVPAKQLFETLEKKVESSADGKTLTISDINTTVKVTADSEVMTREVINLIDGSKSTETVQLDEAPRIVDGELLVPLKTVVEAFGSYVIWDEDTKTFLVIAGVC